MGNDRQGNIEEISKNDIWLDWLRLIFWVITHAILICHYNLKDEKPFFGPVNLFYILEIVSPFFSTLLLSLRRTLDALGERLDPVPWVGSWMRNLWQRIYKAVRLLHSSFSTSWNHHIWLFSQHSVKVYGRSNIVTVTSMGLVAFNFGEPYHKA